MPIARFAQALADCIEPVERPPELIELFCKRAAKPQGSFGKPRSAWHRQLFQLAQSGWPSCFANDQRAVARYFGVVYIPQLMQRFDVFPDFPHCA